MNVSVFFEILQYVPGYSGSRIELFPVLNDAFSGSIPAYFDKIRGFRSSFVVINSGLLYDLKKVL